MVFFYVFLTGLIVGFMFGIFATVAYGLFQMRKVDRMKKEAIEQVRQVAEEMEKKAAGWKDRMTKVTDITKAQIEMRSRLDEPSKNALHSKYKNDMVQEIKTLEEEKIAILRSILTDGHDPEVTIETAEGRKKIKLSEYFVAAGLDTGDSVEPTDPEGGGDGSVRRAGKFVVYSGGNNGTTH